MSQHQGLLCLKFLWLNLNLELMYSLNNLNILLHNSAHLQLTDALNAVAVTTGGLLQSLVKDVTTAVTLFNNQVVVWVKVLLVKVVKLLGQHSQLDKYNQVVLTQQQSLDIFNEDISRISKSN
jgi:hypothetical protein